MSQVSINLSESQQTKFKRLAAKRKQSLSGFLTDMIEIGVERNVQILTEIRHEEYLARILSLSSETLKKVVQMTAENSSEESKPDEIVNSMTQLVKDTIAKKYAKK